MQNMESMDNIMISMVERNITGVIITSTIIKTIMEIRGIIKMDTTMTVTKDTRPSMEIMEIMAIINITATMGVIITMQITVMESTTEVTMEVTMEGEEAVATAYTMAMEVGTQEVYIRDTGAQVEVEEEEGVEVLVADMAMEGIQVAADMVTGIKGIRNFERFICCLNYSFYIVVHISLVFRLTGFGFL